MFGFVSSGCNTWKMYIVKEVMQNHTTASQKGERLGKKGAQFMLLLMKIKPQ